MRIRRSLVAPLVVATIGLGSGGWLLQRGASPEQSVYEQARLFREVLRTVSDRFVDAQDPSRLYDKAITGLLEELGDPHSVFMDPEEYRNLRAQTEGQYGGLGIQIDEREGWITVTTTVPRSPAHRAGILAGDRILEVDGKSAREWSTDEAIARLRGRPGEAVTLAIGRPGVDEPIRFRLVRADIHVESVPAAYVDAGGVGYIELSVFSESSARELDAAITALRRKGMKSLVLDLRGNPGGLLEQGVEVADLFLDRGLAITEMRGRTPDANQRFDARDGDHFPGLPIVVLVNEYSASAAEIVAGALQDHDRALVVGEASYGKGSVQTLYQMTAGSVLKLTTSRWYTPSGRSIQKPFGQVEGDSLGETHPPVADTVKPELYKTDMGRTVRGGGGIIPDLHIVPDTFTIAERVFAAAVEKHGADYRNVLYDFSVRYGRSHPELRPGFTVTPAMLEQFRRDLAKAGLPVDRDVLMGASGWLSDQIAYHIAMSNWGTMEARRIANRHDPQVLAAEAILRQARGPRSLFSIAERSGAGAPGRGTSMR